MGSFQDSIATLDEKKLTPQARMGASQFIGDRQEQQDTVLLQERGSLCLAAVCDGVGGMDSGARASRLAAEILAGDSEEMEEGGDLASFLRGEAIKLDAAVHGLRGEDGAPCLAGTTIVAAVIRERHRGDFYRPVGWLVCVEGADFGKSFPLREGRNTIGRSGGMDVILENDQSVSRREHAWVEYREEQRDFLIGPGEARKILYLNSDPVFAPRRMEKNDVLYLGDSGLMLIPCCDGQFSWKSEER